VLLFGAVALTAACSHPQRPYVFTGGPVAQRTTHLLVDALAAEGLRPATVDAESGLIVTTWMDTGYRFHEEAPFNENAIDVERTILRRYQVAVVPDGAGGTTVRLQAEARRCTPEVTVRSQRLLGDCKEVDTFFPALQTDMDDLGQKLRQAARLHGADPPKESRPLAQSRP
jgi:hypothetical protein